MDDRERLIGLIYDGVTNEEVWTGLLALLADRLHAAGAGLGLQDMETHAFRAVADTGIDRGLHETYARLAPGNRIWQAIGRAARPMTDWMVMPKSELVRSPLYEEWFVPQGFHGVMAAPALARDTLSGVVVAFCSQRRGDFTESQRRGDFTESDLDLLAGLSPHLGRAVGLRLERERFLADLRADHQILDGTDEAILLLDAELQLLHASAAAKGLLDSGERLRVRQRRVVACHPDDDARLQAMLCSAPRLGHPVAEDFAVARDPKGERRPLLITATPLGPPGARNPLPGAAWVLRVRDPERRHSADPAILQRLFGLTTAEAASVEMLPPRSEDEAARRRGIAKSTLRAQLHAAYAKLGVNGRDELVYVLASYGFH